MQQNKISPKWREVSQDILGIDTGRHCHWCSHIYWDREEGYQMCANPNSSFGSERIRDWEGLDTADLCNEFNLNEYYTDDSNHSVL